jgi:hypothetical protein
MQGKSFAKEPSHFYTRDIYRVFFQHFCTLVPDKFCHMTEDIIAFKPQISGMQYRLIFEAGVCSCGIITRHESA